MSLRRQLLQVARLAPRRLGDSTDLVRAFFARCLGGDGIGRDRSGQPDLYYTIFALAGADALEEGVDDADAADTARRSRLQQAAVDASSAAARSTSTTCCA